jgi:hypothetical protein
MGFFNTVLLATTLAMAAAAQSPTQHVVQGGLEVWTMPFSNMPEGIKAADVDRVYGLSVFIAPSDPSIVGYRVQLTVTFQDGAVVYVDELWPANLSNGFCWTRDAVGNTTPPVKLSGLVITPVKAEPAVEIPLN